MPQWGLTEELRRAKPWDIPADWLKPSKVVTDPIHGDIYLSRLEQAIVDSRPFQRLRRIRQLGNVHLVYPGATHTRFSHALGALRVVQDLLDIILDQRNGRDPDRDLFQQWEGEVPSADGATSFEWKVAEVVVLSRLGSLLHDICHVAYGHTIEDDLGLLEPHDENLDRFNVFWGELGSGCGKREAQEVRRILNQDSLKKALKAIILAKRDQEGVPADERLRQMGKYPFVADLVTNTICADLLDYLPRDHAFAGLPVALGQRFMTAFYVVPKAEGEEERHYPERMALRISRGGRERYDIASELLKHLRYRYELQERAIVHHAKLAADSMLGKALDLWGDGLWIAAAANAGATSARCAIEAGEGVEAVRRAVVEDVGNENVVDQLNAEVKHQIEIRIRGLGDDSLLEYLAGDLDEDNLTSDKVRTLAQDILDRRLYKRAARAHGVLAKERVFKLFGGRLARRALERNAAKYAGVPEEQVVIWLPDPRMRLKIAEVLVDFGKGIAPFYEYSERGRDIYADHKGLWSVTVFVHPDVADSDKEPEILARLAELMGIEWDRHKPMGATRPQDWPVCLAASRTLKEDVIEQELKSLLEDVAAYGAPHRSADETFSDLHRDIKRVARRLGRNKKRRQ